MSVSEEIVLVLLGFILGWIPQWFDRSRRIKSHWGALRAEALLCKNSAHALLMDGVMAPLYRLPTVAFESAFPILLIEGELPEEEVLIINRFFAQVQDINRGLDNATAMNQVGKESKLKEEYNRLLLKAKALVEGSNGTGGLSRDTFELINKKLECSRFKR
jgi:hypothetical protein